MRSGGFVAVESRPVVASESLEVADRFVQGCFFGMIEGEGGIEIL